MTEFGDFGEVIYAPQLGENITIRPIRREDIPAVARLYSEVSITKNNYKSRLTPGNLESFENCGGMFLIHEEASLRKLLTNKDELMLVAQDDHNNLCGIIWYSINEKNYKVIKGLHMLSGLEDTYAEIEASHIDRTLSYGKEIIVSKECRIKTLPLVLFYSILSHLKQSGYTHSTGEVYHVNRFFDEYGEYPSDMLNIRSYKTLVRSGGVQIGILPPEKLNVDGYGVTFTSQVLAWNITTSLDQYHGLTEEVVAR